MHLVRTGQVFMPKGEDVDACKMVAYPPTNQMLIEHLSVVVGKLNGKGQWNDKTLVPVRALLEEVQKKKADKEWLLRLLYCFDDNHEVF